MTLTPEEIVQIAQPYKVPFLYKYRSFQDQGLERIFSHQEIFLANYTQFNDPFDCQPILRASTNPNVRVNFLSSVVKHQYPDATPQEYQNHIRAGLKHPVLFERDTLEVFYRKSIKPWGIYSLSEINNDILMWSHYAKAHTGICLKFDSKIENTFFWQALKVHYQKNIPVVDPLLFEEDDHFLRAFAVKSDHWDYEKERRVLKHSKDGGNGIHKFDPILLQGVILGANIRREDEELVYDWIDLYPTSVQLYKATVNRNRYALDIVSN